MQTGFKQPPDYEHFSTNLERLWDTHHPHFLGMGDLEVRAHRATHFKKAIELGFPHPKNERWKYAHLHPLLNKPFDLAAHAAPAPKAPNWLKTLPYRMVFVDGHYAQSLSVLPEQTGLTLEPLRDRFPQQPNLFIDWANTFDCDSLFDHLNLSFAQDGAFILADLDCDLKEPLHLVHLTTQDKTLMTSTQHFIQLNPKAKLNLIECHLSLVGDGVVHHRNFIRVQDDAKLHLHRLSAPTSSKFHFYKDEAQLSEKGIFHSSVLALEGLYQRHETHMHFEGHDSLGTFKALTLPKPHGGHIDTLCEVNHTVPHTHSEQLVKSLVPAQATTHFFGHILIQHGAHDTQADQLNRNVLIEDHAKAHSAPRFEIYCDDVRCNHGAATGPLDPAQIFYLQSRGFDENSAREHLIRSTIESMELPFSTLDQSHLEGTLKQLLRPKA